MTDSHVWFNGLDHLNRCFSVSHMSLDLVLEGCVSVRQYVGLQDRLTSTLTCALKAEQQPAVL